jgi:hypothetical protein
MDINSIKSKLSALQKNPKTTTKKEKIDFKKFIWKPSSEGKTQIRFVTSKFNKEYPFKEVFIHYGYSKFPIYALTNWGEKDPIVEFVKELRKTNDKENWSLAKKLEPKMRVFAPIVVRGEEDKGVRLWEFGKEIYMQLLGIAEDEDYGDYTDIAEGRDFTIDTVIGDIAGRQGLKSSIRIKPKTSPLSTNKDEVELWLNEQPDILEIQFKYTFDKLKEILQNYLDPSAEEEIEETAEETDEESKDEVSDKLPWEKDDSKGKFSMKKDPKKPGKNKFDEIFEEEEK